MTPDHPLAGREANQPMRTNRRLGASNGRAEITLNWIRCRDHVPAAIGDGQRWANYSD